MIDIVKLANGNVAIYDSTSGDFINSLSPDIVEIECNVNGSVKIVQDNGSVEYIDPATVANTEVIPAAAIPFTGTCADLAQLLSIDFFFVVSGGGVSDLATVLIAGNTSGANDIIFNTTQGLYFNNTTRLREGTIDALLGGAKGIAQICSVGYELKWEAGRLYVMDSNGTIIRWSLYNFTTIPTTTDDNTKGYAVGSRWTLDDGTIYLCTNASTASAVWVLQTNAVATLEQVLASGNSAGANDIDMNNNDLLNVDTITASGDLTLNPVGSIDANGKTLNMTGGEIHNIPLMHSQNNVDLTIEGKGTADLVFKTNNVNRLKITDTGVFIGLPIVIQAAASDETTALTVGTTKVTFRLPAAFTLTAVRASLTTAQTSGSIFTVDINQGGSSVLGTKITIDNTEKTSVTAATAATITTSALTDDAEITIDIDQIGDGTAKGLKITLIGTRS